MLIFRLFLINIDNINVSRTPHPKIYIALTDAPE